MKVVLDTNIGRILHLVAHEAETVHSMPMNEQVCSDPDDDIFIAAAIAGKAEIIVSGDKALRKVTGYLGIRILSPSEFVQVLELDP